MPIQTNSFNQQHHNTFDRVAVTLLPPPPVGVHFSLCVCARDMYVFVWPCGDRSLKSHVLLFCFLSYFLGQGLFTEGGVWHFSPANQWTPRVIASVRPQFWDYGGGEGVTTSNNHGYVSSVLLLARQGLHWLSHSPSSLFKDFFFFFFEQKKLIWSGIRLLTDQCPSNICFFSKLAELSILFTEQ